MISKQKKNYLKCKMRLELIDITQKGCTFLNKEKQAVYI